MWQLMNEDVRFGMCCLGNGPKSGAGADVENDEEHISLAPQRSSFLSGCQVKRSAAGPDSKRDGYVMEISR